MTEKPLNPGSYGEEDAEEERRHRHMHTSSLKLPEEDELVNKTLYICSFESYTTTHFGNHFWGAYVVRAINLSDLLTSSPSVKLGLRQVAYTASVHLPSKAGCGVLGSRIVFASGLKPNFGIGPHCGPFGPDSSTEAYAFDTKDPKHGIVKMEETLHKAKYRPLMAEVAGKLYTLSSGQEYIPGSFEVFDPKQGTWSPLLNFPTGARWFSYAIAGTKLFASSGKHSIYCFDLGAAEPKKEEWNRVPSMCQGGPFPFDDKALVLDLPQPEHHNKKLMFTANRVWFGTRLVVYLMSLDENQENISEIHVLKRPELPREAWDHHFFHLGGNNVCIVATPFRNSNEEYEALEPAIHTIQGAAIPFQFEFDISKVNDDKENCFTVRSRFQPPRIFEYYTGPSCFPQPDPLGCFVL